jgi:hypothetical protein
MGSILGKAKAAAKPPNLRDKLSQAFLTAFDDDFQAHGIAVIEALRQRDPTRYCELAGRLIMAVDQPPSPTDFSACQTEADIARQLLTQIGIHDDAITPDMVRQAEEANAALLARLIQIAEGN